MARPMARGPGKNMSRINVDKRPDPVPYTEEQLRGVFWRYDKNKDGRLSKQELKDAFKNLGAFIPWFRTSRALHFADGNGDGYISDEEVDELVKYAFKLGYKVQ